MTETDDRDQAKEEIWDQLITREELERILSTSKISNHCNLCGDYKWYYIHAKDDANCLGWTYLLSGDVENQYQTLSYYTRTCLNCGHMQNFARIVIYRLLEKLKRRES